MVVKSHVSSKDIKEILGHSYDNSNEKALVYIATSMVNISIHHIDCIHSAKRIVMKKPWLI